MAEGKFPGPYVNTVKQDDATMVYVPFPKMGIGARASGLPSQASDTEKMSLEHVGGSAGAAGNRSGKK